MKSRERFFCFLHFQTFVIRWVQTILIRNILKLIVKHHHQINIDFSSILDLQVVREKKFEKKFYCLCSFCNSDEISRTPIQIDSQVPAPSLKLYNHVMPYIIGPDINISKDTSETHQRVIENIAEQENEPKRTSGVEPTLDPTKVLTALVENNNGQLPPYQL